MNEFKIGQIVTVDRYNHIKDIEICEILAFVNFGGFGTELDGYLFSINGTKIVTRDSSIMESKNYRPVAKEDRHPKSNILNK